MITASGNFTLNFKNSYDIYETIIKCKVKEREFLHSLNKSLLVNPNSEDGILKSFTNTDEFQPYVTTLFIYNDQKELMLVAKLNQPVPLSKNTDTIFEIRYDQ